MVDGRADIGIFAERTPTFGLQTVLYRRDRLVLVVPAGHALAARAPAEGLQLVDIATGLTQMALT